MTYSITTEQFTAAMEAAVSEKGEEFVYPKGEKGWGEEFESYDSDDTVISESCLYVRTDVDAPACLIGEALFRCGVPTVQLSLMEGKGAEELVRTITDLPSNVQDAALWAQIKQDSGKTWGEALARYREGLTES